MLKMLIILVITIYIFIFNFLLIHCYEKKFSIPAFADL